MPVRFDQDQHTSNKQGFDNIVGTPDNRAFDDQMDAVARDAVQDKENSGATTTSLADTFEANKLTPETSAAAPKKKGVERIPLSTRTKIAGWSVTGVLGIGGFFAMLGAAPGIAIVNINEVTSRFFGSNLETIISGRTDKVWVKKMNTSSKTASINKLCANGISVGCRFQGMSDKEIAKVQKAAKNAGVNLELEISDDKNVLGKRSVSSITVDGQTMNAKEFASEMRKSNSPVRKATQSMMKPRYISLIGAKMSSLLSKLGLSKAANISKATSVEEANQKIKETKKRQVSIDKGAHLETAEDDSDAKRRTNGEINGVADKVADGSVKSSSIGDRIRTSALKNLSSSAEKTLTNMAGSVAKGILITGYVDTACTVVNTISAIGYMAKAAGALQLMNFAMMISNTADAVKAGEATTASIEAIGTTLSTTVANDSRTFFDSYGWNWVAYGILGDPIDTLEFRVGGGLPDGMTDFANQIQAALGDGEVCNFIQNPFVRAGSAIVGIVAAIFSGGTVTAAQIAGNVSLSAGLSVIQAFSLPILADIVAGEFVNDTTVGNSAGNAYVSGKGAMYSQILSATGAWPLTEEEAVQFNDGPKAAYLSREKEESIAQTGQFDPTNPNSLAGSLTTQLASTINSKSPLDTGAKLLALFSNPLSKTAVAADTDPAAQFKVCPDDDYKKLGIATDPFCNPVYGMSANALALDPDDVIEFMHSNKYIDDNGNPLGDYSTFVSECIENTNPFGPENEETRGNVKSANCIPGKKSEYKEQFWVYTVDAQIYEKMQCVLEENAAACGSSVAVAANAGTGTCPAGTSAIPEITTGWEDAKEKPLTLCAIPELPRTTVQADSEFKKAIYGGLAANNISTHAVNSLAAPSLLQIIQTAKDSGVSIGATFSYRSYNEQKAIRAIKSLDENGNLTSSTLPGDYNSERAEAGRSNHQMGLSIDFDNTSVRWLKICIAQNLDGTDDGKCYGWYDDVGPKDPNHFTYKPGG